MFADSNVGKLEAARMCSDRAGVWMGLCGRGVVGGLPHGTATVTWVCLWALQVGTVGTAALGLWPPLGSLSILDLFVFLLRISALAEEILRKCTRLL